MNPTQLPSHCRPLIRPQMQTVELLPCRNSTEWKTKQWVTPTAGPFGTSHPSCGRSLNRRNSHVVALCSNSNHFVKTIELLPRRRNLTAGCPRFAGDPDPHQAVRLSHRQCHREHAVEVSAARIAHHEIFTRWVVFELCPQGRISLTPLSCKLARFFVWAPPREGEPTPSVPTTRAFFFSCLFVLI